MGSKNYDLKNSFFKQILVLGVIISSFATAYSQDSTSTGNTMGRLDLPTPISIQDLYTYDLITEMYIYTQIIGDFSISYPLILTPEEYRDLILNQQMKSYFKDKIDAADGRKEGTEELQKNLLVNELTPHIPFPHISKLSFIKSSKFSNGLSCLKSIKFSTSSSISTILSPSLK